MSSFRLGMLALTLCLSGCVSSIHPLSSPSEAKPDVRLLGEWKYDKPESPVFRNTGIVYVTIRGHGLHFYFIPNIVKGDTNPDKPASYDGFTTQIALNSFLNIKFSTEDKLHTAYQFYRYTVNGDGGVKVWNISNDEVTAAIRAGKLKGEAPISKTDKQDITITDSSDNLMRFIRDANVKKLFHDEFFECYQVKPKK